MNEDLILCGDVVQLKSGTTRMTIGGEADGCLYCYWFDLNGILCTGYFSPVVLRLVEKNSDDTTIKAGDVEKNSDDTTIKAGDIVCLNSSNEQLTVSEICEDNLVRVIFENKNRIIQDAVIPTCALHIHKNN